MPYFITRSCFPAPLPLKDSVTIATVTTKRGARTIAVDDQTHLIYLPTAEFEAPDPNTSNARPKTIPGTFQVLVVGQ